MKVLVVEPDARVRAKIRADLIQVKKPEIEVVEVDAFSDSHWMADEHLDADIVFVAYDCQTREGGQIAQELKSMHPEFKVVVMSTDATPSTANELGVDAFLYKDEFHPTNKIQSFIARLFSTKQKA